MQPILDEKAVAFAAVQQPLFDDIVNTEEEPPLQKSRKLELIDELADICADEILAKKRPAPLKIPTKRLTPCAKEEVEEFLDAFRSRQKPISHKIKLYKESKYNEKCPDYKGHVVINKTRYEVVLWSKETKAGKAYLCGSLTEDLA